MRSGPVPGPDLPDLVRDSKIETKCENSVFHHVFHESGQSVRRRFVRREEQWIRERELGRGAYGTVFLEKCTNMNGGSSALRAVKELRKFVTVGQELDYLMELEAIVKFSHAKYSHCFVRSGGWFELGDSIFIVMEYLPLGDLQACLNQPLPEREARQISSQILEGLSYMHDNGFVHRDLKPGNIMVVEKGPGWWVKIGDFGISKRRRGDVMSLQTHLHRGTLGYAAPEALGFGADDVSTSYTSTVDIWSVGALIYKLLTNQLVFHNIGDMYLYAYGHRPFPSEPLSERNVSEEGQAFIKKLMASSHRDRPSAKMALDDVWITLSTTNAASEGVAEVTPQQAPAEATHETSISEASKAWSTDTEDTTAPNNSLTLRPVRITGYQPASAEDCEDDELGASQPPSTNHSTSLTLLRTTPTANLMPNTTQQPELLRTPPPEPSPLWEPSDPSSSPTAQWANPVDPGAGNPTIQQNRSEVDIPDDLSAFSSELGTSESLPGSRDKEPLDNAAALDKLVWPKHYFSPKPSYSDAINLGVYCLKGGLQLATCQVCNFRTLTPYTSEEFMNCGHYICSVCLLQLLVLYLLSPKPFQELLCCEQADILLHEGVVVRATKDPALAYLINIILLDFRRGLWACPKGHGPRGGSLMVTSTVIPVWQHLTKCSGCLTDTNRDVRQDAKEKALGKGLYFHQFCVFCREQLAFSGLCRCGWVKPILRLMGDVCVPSKLLGQVLSAFETTELLLAGNTVGSDPFRPSELDVIQTRSGEELGSRPSSEPEAENATDGETWCTVCQAPLSTATTEVKYGHEPSNYLNTLPLKGSRVRCQCGAVVCRGCGMPIAFCKCNVDDEVPDSDRPDRSWNHGSRPQLETISTVGLHDGFEGRAESKKRLSAQAVKEWAEDIPAGPPSGSDQPSYERVERRARKKKSLREIRERNERERARGWEYKGGWEDVRIVAPNFYGRE